MKLEYTNSLMKITGSNQADSHIGGKAADLSSSIGGLRAFADIKVVKILSKGKYNTVFFTTVNEVETPVGTDFVSFKCAHMSDTDYADLGIKIGKTFSKGHICYKSGDLGSPKNFHIHIEFGLGSVKELGHIGVPPNNNYTIQTTRGSIEIYEALFISEGTAFESGNTPADNYTWVSTPSDIGDTGLFLRTSQSSVRIRKSPVTGAYKVTVPLNRDIPIVNFNNKFERDGYQWAAVKYGNEEGFCQIDTKHCYTIKGSAQRLYIYSKYIAEN